jgi:outer membrane protein
MKMKKLLAVSIVSASMISGIAMANTNTMKIGVVNYLDIYKTVPQGEQSLQNLKLKLKPQVETMQAKQNQLSAQMKQFQKNSVTMTKSEGEAKQKEFQIESQAFQKQVMTFRQEEMKKEQALAAVFQSDLSQSIKTIGKKNGYTLILNEQSAPFVSYNANVVNATKAIGVEMKSMAANAK